MIIEIPTDIFFLDPKLDYEIFPRKKNPANIFGCFMRIDQNLDKMMGETPHLLIHITLHGLLVVPQMATDEGPLFFAANSA